MIFFDPFVPTPTPAPPSWSQLSQEFDHMMQTLGNTIQSTNQANLVTIVIFLIVAFVFWLWVNRNKNHVQDAAIDRMTKSFTDLFEMYKTDAKQAKQDALDAREEVEAVSLKRDAEIKEVRSQNTENMTILGDGVNRLADILDMLKCLLEKQQETSEAAAIKLSNIHDDIGPIPKIAKNIDELLMTTLKIKEGIDTLLAAKVVDEGERLQILNTTITDMKLATSTLAGVTEQVEKKRDTGQMPNIKIVPEGNEA